MATYALTVSTNALGLGVISGATVVVERKRTTVNDIYPTSSLSIRKIAANVSGIATIPLEADDGSVFHEVKIFDSAGVLVYKNTIQMPPQAADIEDLPLNDIITESAYQAVQAKDAAQTSATNAANSAASAATSATNASNSASAASTSATNANNSAIQASIILESTMRKITVNTDNDIPNYNTLLSDHIIKVKSSARNGGFSTTYYFDFDNQSLRWIPTVGI